MKTVLKNNIRKILAIAIIVIAVIVYVLSQGSSFAKTNSVLIKIERSSIDQSFVGDKANDLTTKFMIISEKARLKAEQDDVKIYDLSALLQAHLTTIDTIIDKTADENLKKFKESLSLRIIEIESNIVSREIVPTQVDQIISNLYSDIDEIVEQFKEAEGEIDSRMFNEAQVSIQQAVFALGEAQASLELGSAEEATRASLRARRLVKEAQYTVDLALLIKEYLID